jgi:hypothetical protein
MSTTTQTTALRPGRGEPLTPLGVRLSTATLHKLAVDITAGRPVELP